MSTNCDKCGVKNPADIHTCTPKRPTNCGTGYCSCIECVMKPAPVQEPIYQMQMMDGKWIDQAKKSYEYNKAHGHTVRIVYTTPPAAPVPLTDEDRAILEAVKREMDDDGNAPGHRHKITGVWDDDNGELAGKPCAWCMTWKKFTTLIERETAHGITEKGQP